MLGLGVWVGCTGDGGGGKDTAVGGPDQWWSTPAVSDEIAGLSAGDLTTASAGDEWLAWGVRPFWNALFSTGATDTACPIAGDLAFSGGCTDADGREWWGEIAWDDDWGWSSEGFGHDREDGCWEIRSGTTYIEGSAAATSYSFQAGIWTVCEGVVSDGWAADGSATHGFDMDRYDYTWGSNVSLGVRGLGSATLAERDVYVASCAHEPDAGTLTVDADGHTLAYTYDGASACDGAVPVTLDGGDEASASWSTSR